MPRRSLQGLPEVNKERLEQRISDRIHDLMAKSKKSTDPVQSMCLERAAHELIALQEYIEKELDHAF